MADAAKPVAQMVRMATNNSVINAQKNMKPHQFTDFLATPTGAGYIPPRIRFDVTREFIFSIRKEIIWPQKGKAEGKDGLVIELTKLEPTDLTILLGTIWKNVER